MHEVNEQSWLCIAISYLADELNTDAKNAFVKSLNLNSEYAEKFRILKKIWKTNFTKLEEIRDSNTGWEKLKHKINQEIALKYYLRKVNMEKFDKKSISMLHCIDNGLEQNENCNAEKLINAIFIDDKPQYIAPQNDIWSKISVKINGSKKIHKPISSRLAVDTTKFKSRNIYITAITAVAAVIMLFLIIFVFMPNNTSKLAKDNDSKDENNVIIVQPPNHNNSINKNDKKDDNPSNFPPEPDERVKPNPGVVVENKTDKNPNDPENNVIPDNNIKKPDENKTDENKKNPDDVIENGDDDKEKPNEVPEKKIDPNLPKDNFKTEEFVFRTKYDEFDPEKLNNNKPDGFGVQLRFTYNVEANDYDTLKFSLPTKDNGFRVKIDNNHDLHLDQNNDGKFDRKLTKSTYRDFKLQYEDANSKPSDYRLKFVKLNNNWEILPACGLVAKNSYKDSEIMLIDANLNGYFDDINSDFYRFDEDEIQILSNVNQKGENWIKIRPTNSGSSVKIMEYDLQNVGNLQIDAFYKNDVTLRWISIVGNATSITIKSDNIEGLLLPEGDYRISKGIVGDGKTEVSFSYLENTSSWFRVISGRTTVIGLGVDIHLKVSKYKYVDGKIAINRNDVVLQGQKGEIYQTLTSKNNTILPNINTAYLTKDEDLDFVKINLTVQGVKGEDTIYLKIPGLNEPGVYIVNMIEKRFSEFLTGSSVSNSTMKITRH